MLVYTPIIIIIIIYISIIIIIIIIIYTPRVSGRAQPWPQEVMPMTL